MEKVKLNKTVGSILELDDSENESKEISQNNDQVQLYTVSVSLDGKISVNFNPMFEGLVNPKELTDKFGEKFNSFLPVNIEIFQYLQSKINEK